MDQKLIQSDSNSYGSTGSTPPETDFEITSSNFNSIANHIFTINSNSRFLEEASKAIGTMKDNTQLRNNAQSTLFNNKKLIDKTQIEIEHLVKTSKNKDKAYKLQIEKLKNSFKDAVQVFSGLQKVLLIKLRRNLPSEPCPIIITHSEHKYVDNIYDDEEELLSLQQTFQKIIMDKQEEIIEREDALKRIENDVLDVNAIMRNLGNIVNSQGDTIDLIENVVEEVHESVETGRQELEKAEENQRKRRKKTVYFVLLLTFLIIILSALLYITLKHE